MLLPQSNYQLPFAPPPHWIRLRLDDHSTIYLKEPDLQKQTIVYKILGNSGEELQPTRLSKFIIDEERVCFHSICIGWLDFKQAIDVLLE